MAEEFVAQAFTLGGAGDKACDIDETHDGGNRFLRVIHVGQDLDARIRYFYDTDVRFNRAEGIVSHFCELRFRQRIEQR